MALHQIQNWNHKLPSVARLPSIKNQALDHTNIQKLPLVWENVWLHSGSRKVPLNIQLKVSGPISQNGNFYSNDASSPKKSWFQISVKSVEPFWCKKRLRIFQLPIPYCVSLIMVTITSHIFINIFQTVHFSSIKFTRDNEKNMIFHLIPKSLNVWKKNLSDRTGHL